MNKSAALFLKLVTFLLLCFTSIANSQTVLVSGKVVDNTGSPLPGVSIIVEGTSTGRSEERRVGKECRSRWSPDD